MPIYEYYCPYCQKVQEVLVREPSCAHEPRCPACGRLGLQRLLSRTRVVMSEQTRLERLEDPAKWAGLEQEDPVAMAKALKRMGSAFGDDFDPSEVDQALEESMEECPGDPAPMPGEGVDEALGD